MSERLPIIGAERRLANTLGKQLLDTAERKYDWTPLKETPRGCEFQVMTNDFPGGAMGTKVMKVTVEMLHPDDA